MGLAGSNETAKLDPPGHPQSSYTLLSGIASSRETSYKLLIQACLIKSGVQIMEAYCFKCRDKQEIRNPQQVTLKNGRPATSGICPVCSTKVFRIGKS